MVELYRPEYQWTMYGANLARTQAHPAIDLRPPFRVAWRRGVGALMEFPAVVWKGVGYVSNLEGYIHAISLDRGKILWKRRVGTLMAASPGLVPERNELVVPTMSPGELVVLDMRTGRRKWAYPSGRAEPSAAIKDGIAYLGATNGNVYAMDLERRSPKWIYSGGSKVTSSIAVVGNRLYFGDYSGRVICLDARTGDNDLDRQRGLACLRNGCRSRRAGLRALGLLGTLGPLGAHRRASVAELRRLLPLLVARRLPRPRLLRLLRPHGLLGLGRDRQRPLDTERGPRRLRRRAGRRRRRLRLQLRERDDRLELAHGA